SIRRPGGLELDRRRRVGARARLEVAPRREAAERRDQAARKAGDRRVVLADGLVVAAPLDRDAVLGALELALEREEVLVGLEIGVPLDDGEEPAESAAQRRLRVLELPERLRIAQNLGRDLDPRDARAGARDLLQDGALLRRESPDDLDEVRNQVGAALVDVLDLRPRLAHPELAGHETVADGDEPTEREDDGERDDPDDDEARLHAREYSTRLSGGRRRGAP